MTKLEKIYEEFKKENKIVATLQLARSMRAEKAEEGNWEYTFFFDHDQLKKVEAYNGRELIEQYNK